MNSPVETVLGKKIGSTRVVPLVTKIVLIFAALILVSNLTTNYINLMFNRTELIKLTKELLVKDLKDTYSYASDQYEIFQFTKDQKKSLDDIGKSGMNVLKNSKAVVLGIKPDGALAFQAMKAGSLPSFADTEALAVLNANKDPETAEGTLSFHLGGAEYFGVYKYNAKWDMFILRAEELNELYANSRRIFLDISLISVAITVITAVIGIVLIGFILRFVGIMTSAIMKMRAESRMEIINMAKAPNDEEAFLGVAFNSLSSTIDTLVQIFRKFVSRDLAEKAYREMQIRLEGSPQDLSILFSDIRSFTSMTEALGTDIINLLNLHYKRAIGAIVKNDGVIGSLIGDAVLAVYGTFQETKKEKSIQAIRSAYLIQKNAAELRAHMLERRQKLIEMHGELTDEEERISNAVLLEVGVGIDGGTVFYGNIGSNERMTNTVIGDNVNSASRLEGLTRIYNVPVICSEYVKGDIEENFRDHGIRFVELDKVQVKGKTEGKNIFWAIPDENVTSEMEKNLAVFSQGLDLYFKGNWSSAYGRFAQCTLPMARVFAMRTKDATCPNGWNGIWEMKAK